MELKKIDKSYDSYVAKLSFLELKALASALTVGGRGPVADELRRSIEWHFDHVPKPGQTSDELKAEEEAIERSAEGDDLQGAEAMLPEVDLDDKQAPDLEEPAELETDADAEADLLLPAPPDDLRA